MMRRIGITQRVDVVREYDERRDCLDQNWTRLIGKLGLMGIPLPNINERPVEFLDSLSLDGIILSGGNSPRFLGDVPGVAVERDRFETIVLTWACSKGIPVLGVCRGFQMMNHYFGGELSSVQGHVAIRHPVTPKEMQHPFCAYTEVNSYHNFGVFTGELGKGLIPLITAEGGIVEAARLERLPWIAIMWHPEREQPFQNLDMELISMLFCEGITYTWRD